MMFNGDPRKFRSMLRELELKGNVLKLEALQAETNEKIRNKTLTMTGLSDTGIPPIDYSEDPEFVALQKENNKIASQINEAKEKLELYQKYANIDYNQLARKEMGLKDSPIAGASKAVNESVAKRAAEIRERTQKAIDASQGEVFINPPITTNAPPPNVTNTVIPGQQQQVQQPAQQQPSIETRNPDRTLDQSRNQTHFYNESGSSFAIAAP